MLKKLFQIIIPVLMVASVCKSHNVYWQYSEIPRPPQIVSPCQIMVDVTNDLTYRILNYHLITNRNNFAFSPTALGSVLIALYEGSGGRSTSEIHQVLHLPWNLDIIRIGYRDIHRRLRTYFFSQENPLIGLTLNRENVCITPEYETILQFYGYDLGTDMITLKNKTCTEMLAPTTTTPEPLTTTEYPTTTDTSTTEITTIATSTTESSTDTTEISTEASTTTEIPTTDTSTTDTSTTESSTTDTSTTESSTTDTSTTESSTTDTSTTESSTTDTSTTESSTTDTSTTESLTTDTSTTESSTTDTSTTESSTTDTSSTESSTTDTSTTESSTTDTSTTESSTTDASTTESSTTDTSTTESSTTDTSTTESSTTDTSTTEPSTTDTSTTETPTTESTTMEMSTTEMSTTAATAESTNTDEATTEMETTTPPIGTSPATIVKRIVVADGGAPKLAESNRFPSRRRPESSINRVKRTIPLPYYKTVVYNIPFAPEPQVIPDVTLFNFDQIYITPRQMSNKQVIHHVFYLNALETIQTTFKVYNSILNYNYIPDIKSSALELELDSTEYSLMLLVPDYNFDLGYLVTSLKLAPSLRRIKRSLRPRWVQAIIPDFEMKGCIFLTNDLQNMGVTEVFEPSRADFSPMTKDNGIYVKHIQQFIDVHIKTRPIDQLKRHIGPINRPIEISVNHPFLFFIMDKELDVAVMAGAVRNPLNVRIQ